MQTELGTLSIDNVEYKVLNVDGELNVVTPTGEMYSKSYIDNLVSSSSVARGGAGWNKVKNALDKLGSGLGSLAGGIIGGVITPFKSKTQNQSEIVQEGNGGIPPYGQDDLGGVKKESNVSGSQDDKEKNKKKMIIIGIVASVLVLSVVLIFALRKK